jgi:uncharacterized protein YijF (DUF1287 family)
MAYAYQLTSSATKIISGIYMTRLNLNAYFLGVFLLIFSGLASAETSTPATPTNLNIVVGAKQQIGKTLIYDSGYTTLSYPNGDLPIIRGVCSDVIIRALRFTGHDLQALVHQDMKGHFSAYPKIWRLKSTDRNIDHRRVPNLETYFSRRGLSLPVTQRAEDYRAGDIVSWRLDNGLPHIGIVSDRKNQRGVPYIIHNIGLGAREDDDLFSWKIIGHYRYFKSP